MDNVIRRQSEQIDSNYNNKNDSDANYDYRKWEWGYLRTECQNLGLESLYITYVMRLQRSYLSIFLVIHTIIGIVHTVVLVAHQKENIPISPEIYCYLASILIVWISLIATFKEDLVRRNSWLPYIASCTAVIGLVLTDIIIPLYHAVVTRPVQNLRPGYGSYILFTIYIFLPLSDNMHCIILAAATTICYLIEMFTITYRNDDLMLVKAFTEFVFLMGVNLLGFYFRLMNEVAIRRAFLDRRECVEGNLLLKFERDQEKDLLLSILPAHIAGAIETDIRRMIEKIRLEKRREIEQGQNSKVLADTQISIKTWRGQHIHKLYVEHHTGVSVLYADVVNYTYMTTQLPVKVLVETLHELFVKFDQASEEFNVLRIKFLGDCYYGVSGVPIRNPDHAKSCVNLGLRMIKDIRDVRAQKNNLNIDMRIGIHSGSIMSGVIGACKWQYDIWSKDAQIANRLESTGVPGKVHITKQTLDMLDDKYIYDYGTDKARLDPFLSSNGIETFLISPQYFQENNYYIPDDNNNRRCSFGVKRLIQARSSNKAKMPENRPSIRGNFMQNSMEQYNQIRTQTNSEMELELERMPIGKFHFNHIFSTSKFGGRGRKDSSQLERASFNSNVSTILLYFKERKWEWSYMREPDLMLKYSTLLGLFVFLIILTIQSMNKASGWIYWSFIILSIIVLLTFIPITWFKKLWVVFMPVNEENSNLVSPPKSSICLSLFNISRNIMQNAIARTSIYLATISLLMICSLVHLTECRAEDNENLQNNSTNFSTNYSPCLNPWAITESVILCICMSFLFVRIHFVLKLCVSIIIMILYSWVIFFEFPYIFKQSPSINVSLDANISHFLMVLFISIIFHMVDRQTEYISRVDYMWKQQLQKKQEEAESTKYTNKVLVHNILPAHVAEIYMNRQINKDELYYEEYENVAIMFATITNLDIENNPSIDTDKNILNILNSIICDFDEQLIKHTGSIKIEKIKVAGWTYMVACGLDPGRGDSSTSTTGYRGLSAHRSSLLSNGRRSWNTTRSFSKSMPRSSEGNYERKLSKENQKDFKHSSRQSQNAVYVLTEFALNIMKTLDSFNDDNFKSEGMLRIGISHGKVMAGVVGSSKPLYDVWGNAVNMASRMDSTGIPGKIQVTADSATVLRSFGINCDYRGETFVKGRGTIPTYFVCVNQNMEFEKSIQENTLQEETLLDDGDLALITKL